MVDHAADSVKDKATSTADSAKTAM
jgi:hypothetical protein